MRDGSDAIADWPILNALLNTASGATWVSFHHGGGVGRVLDILTAELEHVLALTGVPRVADLNPDLVV